MGLRQGHDCRSFDADGEDTILSYEVTAQIGGKLSQLGGRLIDATAKQMSLAFFKRFAQEIAAHNDKRAPAPTLPELSGAALRLAAEFDGRLVWPPRIAV